MSDTLTRITVKRAKIDPQALWQEKPTLDGLEELPVNTIVQTEDGQPLVAYLQSYETGDPLLEEIRAGLLSLKFTPHTRLNGLEVRAKSFGYLPRIPMRGDWCKSTLLAREHPALVDKLITLGAQLEARYRDLAPEVFAFHSAQADKVLEDWRLPGNQCFTGGTINRDNSINYHQDRGNFKGTFSAMPVIRKGMSGGELCVPELGVYLPAADGTVTYFDGQDLWHAVTPMRKEDRAAHRFSAVYYSLTQLWNCLPPVQEVERAQAKRVTREGRRRRGEPVPNLGNRKSKSTTTPEETAR